MKLNPSGIDDDADAPREMEQLFDTIKSNIQTHENLDKMPQEKYSEEAYGLFKEIEERIRNDFMQPDHGDFSQGAMDAHKNQEDTAYNLFMFLRVFSNFTFAKACNYIRNSISSSRNTFIKQFEWHDPDEVVGSPAKKLTLYDDDFWPTQDFFKFLLSNITDNNIKFVLKGDDKPLSFHPNVTNTGFDGSGPGVQTELHGIKHALKKIVTDPSITAGSLNINDNKRVMLLKHQNHDEINFKVMSFYSVISSASQWGQLNFEKKNPLARYDFQYMSLHDGQQLFSSDHVFATKSGMQEQEEEEDAEENLVPMISSIDNMISEKTEGYIVRTSPLMLFDSHMDNTETYVYLLYTLCKDDDSSDDSFYGLITCSMIAFSNDKWVDKEITEKDNGEEEIKETPVLKWVCFDFESSTIACNDDDDEEEEKKTKNPTKARINNHIKTGVPNFWSYVVLHYMIATKYDPMNLPSLQDWFELSIETRNMQTDLKEKLGAVFNEIMKGMTSMTSYLTIQKLLGGHSKLQNINRLIFEETDKEKIDAYTKNKDKQLAAVKRTNKETMELFGTSAESPHPCMRVVFNGSGSITLREKKHAHIVKMFNAVDDLVNESAANAGSFVCNKVFSLASVCVMNSNDILIEELTNKLRAAEEEAEKYKNEAEKYEKEAKSAQTVSEQASMQANLLKSDALAVINSDNPTNEQLDTVEQNLETAEAQCIVAADAAQLAQAASASADTARKNEKRKHAEIASAKEERRQSLRLRAEAAPSQKS